MRLRVEYTDARSASRHLREAGYVELGERIAASQAPRSAWDDGTTLHLAAYYPELTPGDLAIVDHVLRRKGHLVDAFYARARIRRAARAAMPSAPTRLEPEQRELPWI